MRTPRTRCQPTTCAMFLAGFILAACGDRTAPPLAVPPATASRPIAPEAPPRLIGGSLEAPTCGLDRLPECPLQRWMDHHLNGPLSRGDFPALAASFRELASVAPAELSGWRPWAEGGAIAAERRDVPGVQRACNGCHDGYRARFRATMRTRALLPVADPP
jgi:hypothetical protein